MNKLVVGLLNDSFPPTIDGVASVALNYAKKINEKYGTAVVATPYYPKVVDNYPFEVLRYPSIYVNKKIGYRAGLPFDPITVDSMVGHKIDILHTHCPAISTYLARLVRAQTKVPIILTWHSKFDVDIKRRIASDFVRQMSIKFLLNNINACDEVWAVSEGAGQNLREMGYKGDYIVMPNGTDFEKRRSSVQEIAKLRTELGLENYKDPIFLFVGRMMWYKGLRIILDGLKELKANGKNFKMIFVGDGYDRPEVMKYANSLGLSNDCIFPGAITNREKLRVFFCLADIFLFPSTYDTNGIVVREAAACSCGSILIKDSCAAEGIVDGDTGIIIEENASSMTKALLDLYANPQKAKTIGQNAADKIYISWDDAVAKAYARYEVVIEKYKNRVLNTKPLDEVIMEWGKRNLIKNYRYSKKWLKFWTVETNLWAHDFFEEAKYKIHNRFFIKMKFPWKDLKK